MPYFNVNLCQIYLLNCICIHQWQAWRVTEQVRQIVSSLERSCFDSVTVGDYFVRDLVGATMGDFAEILIGDIMGQLGSSRRNSVRTSCLVACGNSVLRR